MTGPSNPIENPTPHPALKPPSKPRGLTRDQMAWRVAKDIPGGSYVNLGIGMPELVALHLPQGKEGDNRQIVFHSENGILGMGPPPPQGEEDFRFWQGALWRIRAAAGERRQHSIARLATSIARLASIAGAERHGLLLRCSFA